MSKDAVATMGAVLPDNAGGRDAVHVAVFSAICQQKVFPGQDIAVVSHGDRDAVVTIGAPDCVAIVDPFLRAAVPPGERFWAYLYPRTITALSHRWSHPAFEGQTDAAYAPPSAKLESELWLTKFCAGYSDKNYGFDMRAVLEQIFDGTYGDEEYLTVYGSDEKGPIPHELWRHCEVVFGKPAPTRRPTYFSCSC